MANKRIEMVNKVIYEGAVKQKPEKIKPIEPKPPIPTEKDYENGYITRYFTRQANSPQSEILEISQEKYTELNTSATGFYKTIELDWKITGDLNSSLVNGVKHIGVLEANQNSINEAEKDLPNMSMVLNNLVQFYIGVGKTTSATEGGGTPVTETSNGGMMGGSSGGSSGGGY